MTTYSIDPARCIRCGVSTSVAPGMVRLGKGAAVFVAQPRNAEEVDMAEAARLLCPVEAISARGEE